MDVTLSAPRFIVRDLWLPDELRTRLKNWHPGSDMGRIVKDCLHYLPADLAAELLDRITSTVVVESSLSLVHGRTQGPGAPVIRVDHGVVCNKVVTTAGVNYIVAVFGGTGALSNFKYHAIGTGSLAESVADTALGTELTTGYNPANTRATGTTTTGASANVYRTAATNTVAATVAITEHGVLTQAAVAGGTLLDRSVFSALNLVSGDTLTSTYDLTFSAGG